MLNTRSCFPITLIRTAAIQEDFFIHPKPVPKPAFLDGENGDASPAAEVA